MVWNRKVFGMERLRGKSIFCWRDCRLNVLPVVAGFCLTLLWLAVASARAATFTASLDDDTLTLGQSTTLSLTFEGERPGSAIQPGGHLTECQLGERLNEFNRDGGLLRHAAAHG